MNALPPFPATPVGLVYGLIYWIVALLASCVRACGADTGLGMMPEIRARFVAVAARLTAVTRHFVQPAARGRIGTQQLHAGPAGLLRAPRLVRRIQGDAISTRKAWLDAGVRAGRGASDMCVTLTATCRPAVLIEALPQVAGAWVWRGPASERRIGLVHDDRRGRDPRQLRIFDRLSQLGA